MGKSLDCPYCDDLARKGSREIVLHILVRHAASSIAQKWQEILLERMQEARNEAIAEIITRVEVEWEERR